MAAALRSRKALVSCSESEGVSKKVEKARPQEGQGGVEPEGGQEDACKSPSAKPAGDVGGQSSPSGPPGSQPKPAKSFQLWETEYQEFLEGSVLEDQLLEQLSPWANTRGFLASFEQVAMACRWPRKEWVVRLLPSLSEDAEKAFVSLSAEDRQDFQKVKMAILRREAAARDKKREEFRRLCYQDMEGPRGAHARLQELCHQWMNVERSTKEQVLEMLILEQFLKILPQEMQYWVKDHVPENCAQAVALAEDFLRKLQGAEEGEEVGAEVAASVPVRTEEMQLSRANPLTEKPREMAEKPNFSRKGIRDSSVSKKGYLQWARYGEAKLKAKFPGRVNTVLPYHWKQDRTALERRFSEPPRRGRPRRTIETFPSPPPLPLPPPPSSSLPELTPTLKPHPFLDEGSLQSPIQTCPDCSLTFRGVASLRRHQMFHTGEERYSCSFCGKGFYFKSEMRRHECRHVGRKPHECSFCGRSFDRKWWRDQHQMEHVRSAARL